MTPQKSSENSLNDESVDAKAIDAKVQDVESPDVAAIDAEASDVDSPKTESTQDATSPQKSKPSTSAKSSPSLRSVRNTNRWDTRALVTMALLCAISVLLSFIEFPLLPAATFLKFDASAMPAMVCGFAYGTGSGLAVGIIGAIIHGLLMADFSGAFMNILVVIGYVLPSALIYKRFHNFGGACVGLVLGIVLSVILAVVGNLIVTPAFLGAPLESVIAMIWPILVPFNLLKGIINSVLTLLIYKSVSNLITPTKNQVKGR